MENQCSLRIFVRDCRAGGQASFEGTSMYMYTPPRGIFLSSISFPEEQFLVYWFPRNRIEIWGSGGLPPEKIFLTQTVYNVGKCLFRR